MKENVTTICTHLSIQKHLLSVQYGPGLNMGTEKMTSPHFLYILSARYHTRHFICLIWLSLHMK